jgi:hypothetical protein
MKKEKQKEFVKLAGYLWKRINAADSSDKETLNALSSITFDLMETFDGEPYAGVMWELNMWIGLKRDAPEDFKDYGEKTREAYPEYFEGMN